MPARNEMVKGSEISNQFRPLYSMDFIFSQFALRTAHTYNVVVNDQSKNPRVVRVIKEIIKKKKS